MPRPYEAFDRGTNRLRSCYAAVRPGGGTRVAPVAYIEHQIPGRVRLRIPERRGDAAFFQRIVGTLSKLPDVTELDGSPLTGSIRIRHKGPSEAIMAAAGKEGLFEIGKREGEAEPKKPPEQSGASTTAPHGDAGTLELDCDRIIRPCAVSSSARRGDGQCRREFLERLWGAAAAAQYRHHGGIWAAWSLPTAARTMAWLGVLALFLRAGGAPDRCLRSGGWGDDGAQRAAQAGCRVAQAARRGAQAGKKKAQCGQGS